MEFSRSQLAGWGTETEKGLNPLLSPSSKHTWECYFDCSREDNPHNEFIILDTLWTVGWKVGYFFGSCSFLPKLCIHGFSRRLTFNMALSDVHDFLAFAHFLPICMGSFFAICICFLIDNFPLSELRE